LKKSETMLLETENQMQRLAMNDILTGLANRSFMRHALQTAIKRAAHRPLEAGRAHDRPRPSQAYQ
jgi:GGDEF domain-containing protein